jgi:hypothetical protein
MSAVCVLTPVVIGAWPAIATAIAGAAAALGYSVRSEEDTARASGRRRVETDVANSEVIAENLTSGQRMVLERGGITLEFARDERGRCTVCASGEGFSDGELRRAAEEASGRVVQQFVYHKLMTELKSRSFSVVEEEVLADRSVHVRVRRG